MQPIAEGSMDAYRGLIDDPSFWPWYLQATPIEFIAGLPMASRPISRKAASEVDFEGLRAIPWVFAWTQPRYTTPGWYGVGTGLQRLIESDAGALEKLRAFYREWPFFQAVVENALREMARARFAIASRYADRAEPAPAKARDPQVHETLQREFDQATQALLAITEQDRLLAHSPVIEKSIRLRNPYTDVLNLVQLELLQRWHRDENASEEEREAIRHALFVSINGIAAAMQSTG